MLRGKIKMIGTLENYQGTITIEGIDFYNVNQLSEILKTTKYTIRKYFREGKFPPVRVAGNYYLSKKDLSEFMREGKIERLSYNLDKDMISRENLIENAKNSLEYFRNYLETRKSNGAGDSEIKALKDVRNKIKNYLEKYKKD